MKLMDLIINLQSIIANEGNIDVFIIGGGYDSDPVKPNNITVTGMNKYGEVSDKAKKTVVYLSEEEI